MRTISHITAFILLLFIINEVESQENSLLDDIVDQFDENVDVENFEQSLAFLENALSNPINLNKIGAEDLANFFFLSDVQQLSFIHYRITHGKFISIWELQAIPYFDKKTCDLMKPFITISETKVVSVNQILKDSRTEMAMRVERDLVKRKGFLRDENGVKNYAGDQNKMYLSYKNSVAGLYSVGFNVEKDAGEKYWWKEENLKGFDHLSFHLEAKNVRPWLKQVNLGDYYLNIGQGIVTYMGYSGGKSTSIAQLVKKNNLIKAFKSRSEYNYMRGVSAEITLNRNLQITPFISNRKRDANIITDSIETYFTSLQNSGLHRTSSEIHDAKSINNLSAGIQTSYFKSNLLVNITYLKNRFNPESKPANRIYNQFYFKGKELNHLTTDYRLLWKKGYLFGELAITDSLICSGIQGILLNPSPKLDIAFVARYYDKKFNSLYSSALAEGSRSQNEIGIFTALNFHLGNGVSLDTYIDVYQHPWYRYQIPIPTKGFEWRMKLDLFKKKHYDLYVNFSYKNEEDLGQVSDSNYQKVSSVKTNQLRIHYTFLNSKIWELRTRIELKNYEFLETKSFGYLIYQELIYQPLGSRLVSSARFSYFNTDDYNSRVYAYERNINYVFSIPVFYNEGVRTYLNLRYKIPKGITIENRLEFTYYLNQNTISSGNQLIDKNYFLATKIQLIWRL